MVALDFYGLSFKGATIIIFMSTTKIGENMPPTRNIYLVFKPLEMQKKLKQTKVYHTFFLLYLEGNNPQTFKVAAVKILFSCVHVIGTTCFDGHFYSM